MKPVLAFDIYGTLIDTAGVVAELETIVGERARAFSDTWRQKQLEYSFRRALMRNYRDFAVCTRQALEYTSRLFGVEMAEEEHENLLKTYRILPSFADAMDSLPKLAEAGFLLYAFSNGRADDVRNLLRNAGLEGYIKDVVSTGDVGSYKPDPAVYAHFLDRAGVSGQEAWMISSNPFDVIGAIGAGMRAAWVKRSHNPVFDPWEIEPTITVDGLGELQEAIERFIEGINGQR